MMAARRRQNPRRRPVHRRITPAVRYYTPASSSPSYNSGRETVVLKVGISCGSCAGAVKKNRTGSGILSASGGNGFAGGAGGRISVNVFSRHDDQTIVAHGTSILRCYPCFHLSKFCSFC
ncbi:hypothetical protein Hdeb2414_s0002g00047121 [Helianthus debilis subsp. tardiflorus]